MSGIKATQRSSIECHSEGHRFKFDSEAGLCVGLYWTIELPLSALDTKGALELSEKKKHATAAYIARHTCPQLHFLHFSNSRICSRTQQADNSPPTLITAVYKANRQDKTTDNSLFPQHTHETRGRVLPLLFGFGCGAVVVVRGVPWLLLLLVGCSVFFI